MTVHETTIAKIQLMPEKLVSEVYNFVDFLMTRSDKARWLDFQLLSEGMVLTDTNADDYLPNLEVFEKYERYSFTHYYFCAPDPLPVAECVPTEHNDLIHGALLRSKFLIFHTQRAPTHVIWLRLMGYTPKYLEHLPAYL